MVVPLTRRGLREIYVREGMDRGAKLPTADNNPEIERYGNGDTCIPLFTTPAHNLTSNFTLPLFANFIRLSMPLLSCPRRERRGGKVWSCKRETEFAAMGIRNEIKLQTNREGELRDFGMDRMGFSRVGE